MLTGGDKAQSSLEWVRRGGAICFPFGVTPEPQAPDGVELVTANAHSNPTLLDELNRLVSLSDFQVHIAQTFALEAAAQAQEALKKHYLGKIVLRVSSE